MHISVLPGRHRGRGVLLAGTALGAALATTASGCSGNDADKVADAAAKVTIMPVNGTGRARPDLPISVLVTGGRLLNVTVLTNGTKVVGEATADGRGWQSRWNLEPDTTYHVMATALGEDGRTRTVTSSFKTAKPRRTLAAAVIAPGDGETVGVGMPILLHFDHKITDKAEVERSLEVRSSTPVEGAWRWYGDQDVFFRTKKYWPRHTKVRLIAHVSGVRAGKDLYGARNINLAFKVGDQHISVASSRSHHMIVKRNGKRVRDIPVSMGRGGSESLTTTSGTHLTMEKSYMTHMTGPGYSEDVYWTVRISNSGEYVHSAPWSVAAQGSYNVSHGCINASPSNAIWFYHFTKRGDVVKVTGTSRKLAYDNGWGFWQMPWSKWKQGSATKRAVTTLLLNGQPAPVRNATSSAVTSSTRPAAPRPPAPPKPPATTPGGAAATPTQRAAARD